jgi:thiosulfate/3-mercaptopyruvate sulfurtransferase
MPDRSDFFVSTEWLAERLGDPDIAVVDGSWHLPMLKRDARSEYLAAHIPGAVYFDIDAVADTSNPLPHMLPTSDAFAAAVGALGIDDKQRIVVYDSPGLSSAPRVWWTFRIMGATQVVILDGGLSKWQAEGRPVDTGDTTLAPKTFNARFDAAAVFALDQIRDGVAAGAFQFVDARSRERFLGEAAEPRPGVRSGRVPGTCNLPFPELIEDGRLKDPESVRRAFAAAGVDLDRPIVTSCGSGVTAAILTLALETVGVTGTGLYDGSWAEWGGRDDTEVATGPVTESER